LPRSPQGNVWRDLVPAAAPRLSTAVAINEVELVSINNENVTQLMNEYPVFVVDMLREMALRLREAGKLID